VDKKGGEGGCAGGHDGERRGGVEAGFDGGAVDTSVFLRTCVQAAGGGVGERYDAMR